MVARLELLLLTEPAFQGVLSCLTLSDLVYWAVYALEFDVKSLEHTLYTRPHFDLRESPLVLYCAAAHGCMNAMFKLRISAKQDRFSYEEYAKSAFNSEERARETQLMHWVNSFRPDFLPNAVMATGARLGDLHTVQWLHTATNVMSYDPCLMVEEAASRGNLEIVQWIADIFQVTEVEPEFNIHVLVPFDKEMEIMAWVAHDGETERRCFATRKGLAPVYLGQRNDPLELYDAVSYAVELGDLELLKVLWSSRTKYKWEFSAFATFQAAKCGHWEVLQWLIENGVQLFDLSAVQRAVVKSGRLEIAKWLHATGKFGNCSYDHVQLAARRGHLDMIKWIYEQFPSTPYHESLMQMVVLQPFWNIVRWLVDSKGLRLDPKYISTACFSKDVDLVKWMLGQCPSGYTFPPTAFREACASGSIEMVQFLAEEHGQWDVRAVEYAVFFDRVDLAKWLVQTGRPFQLRSYDSPPASREFEKLELIEWILTETEYPYKFVAHREFVMQNTISPQNTGKSNCFPWAVSKEDVRWKRPYVELILKHRPQLCLEAKWLSAWAARFRHVDLLHRFVEIGMSSVFTKANLVRIMVNTKAGSIVRLFLEKHPEWLDFRVLRWAAKHQQIKLLEFIFTKMSAVISKKRFQFSVNKVISTASLYGHLSVVKWVRSNASSFLLKLPSNEHSLWKSAMVCAAKANHVHILQWLETSSLAGGERTGSRAVRAAMTRDRFEALKWFDATGNFRKSTLAASDLRSAMGQGHVHVVDWMLTHKPELQHSSKALSEEVDSFLAKWGMLRSPAGAYSVGGNVVKSRSASKRKRVADDTDTVSKRTRNH